MDKPDSLISGKARQGGPSTTVTPLSQHRRKVLGLAQRPAAEPVDEARLASLRETIEQLPELDATRVVRLHHRIVAGDYEIDSNRLAEKLLSLESLLSRE
ncbi:MAG: flagellar biosynthesis anti-sigma factor FlgM [Pseudohongiellaceae bacterium]